MVLDADVLPELLVANGIKKFNPRQGVGLPVLLAELCRCRRVNLIEPVQDGLNGERGILAGEVGLRVMHLLQRRQMPESWKVALRQALQSVKLAVVRRERRTVLIGKLIIETATSCVIERVRGVWFGFLDQANGAKGAEN